MVTLLVATTRDPATWTPGGRKSSSSANTPPSPTGPPSPSIPLRSLTCAPTKSPSRAGSPGGWAAPPDPRTGPWLRLLKQIAADHNLVPEFEITLEGTHHGPVTSSTEEYCKRQDAAQFISAKVSGCLICS
ncbi:hypothetical protein Tsubulata_018401 [Turnera subulata]|uniref:Uncharacterized protein n=1 Tax=Turnera subulata TaxID=218843 RepID=A0A9Q0G7Z5_9ROSI|nr:hypothetical protein Tsubulata_018401 [Turnera subulata]